MEEQELKREFQKENPKHSKPWKDVILSVIKFDKTPSSNQQVFEAEMKTKRMK